MYHAMACLVGSKKWHDLETTGHCIHVERTSIIYNKKQTKVVHALLSISSLRSYPRSWSDHRLMSYTRFSSGSR